MFESRLSRDCPVSVRGMRKVGKTRHDPDIQGQPTDIIYNRCFVTFYKYVKI